jgi:hypothetical protein
MVPARKHLYDPRLGADFAVDLCDDHARDVFNEDPIDRFEVSTPAPGTPCEHCAEDESAEAAKAEAKAFLAGLPFGDEVPS